ILKALGSEENVDPDVEDLVVLPGDVLLMCSDGLTKYVRDPEILQMVAASGTLEQSCNTLIQAAKDRGGDDNITCLLLKILELPWYKNILRTWFSATPLRVSTTGATATRLGEAEPAKPARAGN